MSPRRHPKRLFAVDQNFPEPIISTLTVSLGEFTELVPVRNIGDGLGDVDDWELLLALYRDERPWDGLITCDAEMLVQPKEMVVLAQTSLTLVVTEATGHNPIKAVGTLLCHLAHVCHATTQERAQVWRLKVSQKQPEQPTHYIDTIASRRGANVGDIWAMNKLSNFQLHGPGPDEQE
ncbi:MAG: hypothetical protein ACRDQZ_09960 [Mycobacteriales bacterium]